MAFQVVQSLDEPVRLRAVREGYFGGVTSLSEVADLYLRWVSTDEGLLIVDHNMSKNTFSHIGIKARKRGNDVHEYFMHRELDPLIHFGRSHESEFFEDDNRFIWSEKTSKAFTRAIYLTLEYDGNRYDVNRGWLNLQHDFNLFLAKLRKHYGKISYVRTVEAHFSNLPHIHVVIVFKEHEFKVFKYKRAKGEIAYLVNSVDRDDIRSLWSYSGKASGFVDVVALRNYGKTMSYICKYIMKFNSDLKNLAGDPGEYNKSLYTLTLNWVFHKKAYSMSKDFLEVVERYRRDASKHKSNLERFVDFDNEVKFRKWYLDDFGNERFDVHKFYYAGSYLWRSLVVCSNYSVLSMDKVPYIIDNLDVSRLSQEDKLKLDSWVSIIDALRVEKAEYMEISARGHFVHDGMKWCAEMVCKHCRKYRGTREQIKAHVDGDHCPVIIERKRISDLRLRNIENYFV